MFIKKTNIFSENMEYIKYVGGNRIVVDLLWSSRPIVHVYEERLL
jgi:hypothetical protein